MGARRSSPVAASSSLARLILAAIAIAPLCPLVARASSPTLSSPAVQRVLPLGARGLRVTEHRLTTETYDQFDPSISSVYVVFTQAEGTGEIFRVMINGYPGPLVEGPGNQFEPDLWGTRVVDTNDVTGLHDVWLFDWMTQENYKVSASFMPDYEPAISGSNIVFTSHKNFNEDIYWYNTGTPDPSRISWKKEMA